MKISVHQGQQNRITGSAKSNLIKFKSDALPDGHDEEGGHVDRHDLAREGTTQHYQHRKT